MEEISRDSLAVRAPFNLQATVRLIQRRPSNEVDHWENGSYLRAFETANGVRLATVSNNGTIDAPALRLQIDGGPVANEIAAELAATFRLMLGLDHEPAPTDWLVELEPAFEPIATALRGFRCALLSDIVRNRLPRAPVPAAKSRRRHGHRRPVRAVNSVLRPRFTTVNGTHFRRR